MSPDRRGSVASLTFTLNYRYTYATTHRGERVAKGHRRQMARTDDNQDRDPPASPSGVFEAVGAALRYLRQHGGARSVKQKDVAARAGITKGMLSSYETGKQEPSLPTLGRLLDALGADLARLQWALGRVGRPADGEGFPEERPSTVEPGDAARSPFAPGRWSSVGTLAEEEVPYGEPDPPSRAGYRLVEVPEPLSSEEERALGQMLAGFYSFLRYRRG